MTNLTEQWKKGELEEYKRYYCKTIWFEDIFMSRCHNKGQNDEWWTLENEKYSYNNVHHIKDIEVLAEVPSYEEWDKLNNACHELEKETACLTVDNVNLKKWCEEFNALDVAKENTKLKELLKEIRGKLHYINTPVNQHNIFSNDFIKKLDQVLGEE